MDVINISEITIYLNSQSAQHGQTLGPAALQQILPKIAEVIFAGTRAHSMNVDQEFRPDEADDITLGAGDWTENND